MSPLADRTTFLLDGTAVPFVPGETVMQAALAAGHYIPHLCFHREFKPHGSCKVCTVRANGQMAAACTLPAQPGLVVECAAPDLDENRRTLVQMLFVEGNHFCPSCEKSGNCLLQAVAYDLEMLSTDLDHFYPNRPIDASHPQILLDLNRCILCELCVRASAEVDGKHVFALSGRGITKHLVVNAESGRLVDTTIAATDKAVDVCPVGAILRKGVGFRVPIGQRRYDLAPVSAQAKGDAPRHDGSAP
ncbi:MAG TPA: 2Fe-2S iron-sulfur cluster-binding protein [Casimicrobiaceae bacterium]|nr:2Fe-2S iron-sulfur cluster-binding protein [Casimicrobiaceae bacterium]